MQKNYPYIEGKWIIDKDMCGREYSYEIKLSEEEAKSFKEQYNRSSCRCGYEAFSELPILGYGDHNGGWNLKGYPRNPYWLYVHCPACGYESSIWKIGVKRERY